jgi:2'-5' RNA ligase
MPKNRRHYRQLNFRPPLPRRAIVWFPVFEDAALNARIERFRTEHDPLHTKIAPHVALVFPFHANMTVAQIASHVKRVLAGWPLIPVTFHGVESVADKFILLMCELRRDAITALHDRLYRGVLKQFLRDDIVFQPHLTLGSGETYADFSTILADAELLFRDTTSATLRSLSIVTYHDDGRITVDETVTIELI